MRSLRPGARRRTLPPAAVLALLLLMPGCSGSTDDAPLPREMQDAPSPGPAPAGWTTPAVPVPCLPLAGHCLAPMPSNLLTRPDPSTPTGLRVDLTEAHFSEGVFEYAARFLDPAILNMADGFSPAGEIVIPLTAPPAAGQLPVDLEDSVRPDGLVQLLDTASGERVPFHARVEPDGRPRPETRFFLILIPARPLALCTPHIVVLRKGILGRDGAPVPAYAGFEELLGDAPRDAPDPAGLRERFRGLAGFLEERMGVPRDELLLAFDFTTRSAQSLYGPMLHLRDATDLWAARNPPEPAAFSVREGGVYPSQACEVHGRFATPSFRTPAAPKRVTYDEAGRPRLQGTEEVDFLLQMPRIPAGQQAPVVVFGHGLWVFKETVLQVAENLLAAGFAVISIDAACHGSRIPDDGFIADLFHLESVQEAVSCLVQTVADELTLAHMVRGSLADLDLLPRTARGAGGDGVPDLDTARIYYVGQSMGTVIGLTFTALSPDVAAAVLNVPGSGIVSIVTNGELTEPWVGRPFIPEGTDPLDAHLLYLSGQMFLDYLDPINFAPRVCHAPLPGSGRAKQVLLQQSQNDGLIPNWVTDIMARALDIPVVQPEVYRPCGLRVVPSPAHGSGVFQYEFTEVGYLAHLLLLLVPESGEQMVDYLASRHRQGEAVIHDPFADAVAPR